MVHLAVFNATEENPFPKGFVLCSFSDVDPDLIRAVELLIEEVERRPKAARDLFYIDKAFREREIESWSLPDTVYLLYNP